MSLADTLASLPKPYLNANVNALMANNPVMDRRTPTAINVTGGLSAAQVWGGLITSSTAAAVTLTFPSGFAAALVALMNQGNQLSDSFECTFANSGPNSITLASSDASTTFFTTRVVATNSVARFLFRISDPVAPAIIVY